MNQQLAPAAVAAPEAPDGFTQDNGLPAGPIVIGVVGHRGIRDADRAILGEALRAVFREFRDAYPRTPLVVLSALAEGSDQVAARAALESGAFVRAPLPFPPEIYRRSTSFDGEAGRAELDTILAHERVEWFVVPLPDGMAGPGTDWHRVATDRTDEASQALRHACYANAGGYITRRCNVLIALQDERDQGHPRGPSGTAEYVAFKLHGRAPAGYPWAFAEPLGYRNERRLVLTIDAPRAAPSPDVDRAGGLSPDRPAGQLRVLVPNDQDERWIIPQEWLPLAARIGSWARFWARVGASLGFLSVPRARGSAERQRIGRMRAELRQFRETCTNVDDFNRDLALPAVAAAIRERLADEARSRVGHFDEKHDRWLRRLSRIRDAAAALSRHLQPQLDRALLFVLTLLGLSILSFHFYAHLFVYDPAVHQPRHDPIYLGIFLALLLAAAAIVVVVWWSRLDERRLDARSLAEALRVRRAWSMAGLNRSVADSYAGQVRSEMSWVRQSLLHVCPPPQVWTDQFHRLTEDQQLELLGRVRREWVEGQVRQLETGHRTQHNAAMDLRRWGFGLAVIGWVILAILFSSSGWAPTADEGRGHEAQPASATAEPPLSPWYPRDWILILASSLVIAGGLCIAYCERRSYEELSKHYERMAILFANGNRELGDRLARRDIAGAQRVIAALGEEAIIEHVQWLILRRARQLELHIGG